jgi:predicted Zn finger-like uncharacterized protein
MRLICPNCGAQYEVPDDVIPEEGRDVQCSNCGHTWLEQPGKSEADEFDTMPEFEPEPHTEDAAIAAFDDDVLPIDVDPDPIVAPEPEPEPVQDDAPEPVEDDLEDEVADFEMPAAQPEPEAEPDIPDAELELAPAPSRPTRPVRRRPLDPEVAEILREEAEREKSRRQAEANSDMQSQSELSLDPSPLPVEEQRAEEARRRVSRLKGEEPSVAAAMAEDRSARRRELLPDIEEINSSLRSTSERGEPSPVPNDTAPPVRRGFRLGFFSVILLAAIAACVYVYADLIGQQVPQLIEPLTSYVAWVDELRLWLDLKIQALLTEMDSNA